MTPTPFESALDSASDQVIGYATTAAPIVGLVAAAWLAVKYVKRVVRGL
jgi:hypothetical protein